MSLYSGREMPASTVHNTSTYGNWGCRCDVCTAANAATVAYARASRAAERTVVDGRMVALKAPTHGSNSTYNNWFCRCRPCTDAHNAIRNPGRRDRGAS